jgi:hypothetical protein
MAAVKTTQSTVTAPDSSLKNLLKMFLIFMVFPFKEVVHSGSTPPQIISVGPLFRPDTRCGMSLINRMNVAAIRSEKGIFAA